MAGTIKSVSYTPNQKARWAIFAVFSAIFAYATLTNPARQFATPDSPVAAYYLPDWLLALTIVIPYIVVWFFGYQSAYHINMYRRNIHGEIYRKSLGFLSGGIVAIVGAIILIRTLTSATVLVKNFELQVLLVLLYLLLFIVSLGFTLVAVGIRRLKKIEEV